MDRGKLLIVDDDPHIRRLLRVYLRDRGYEIFEAANGEEAGELLAEHRFAVVLLDLILPHAGGFLLCQKAKNVEGSAPYVVMMTGEDSPEMRTAAQECGADRFLAKPFTREEIVAALPSPVSA